MALSDTLSTAFTGIVATCALVVTINALKDGAASGVQPASPPSRPEYLENWEALAAGGHREGPANAPVTVIVFADFECPVCQRFWRSSLRPVLRAHRTDAALVYQHFPLSYHRFAYPAARASECAAEQGRFFPFHDGLYEKQDSLGLKSFTAFAADAGVPDLLAFDECNRSTDSVRAVASGTALGIQAGATGTPTILVNGYRFAGAIDSARFHEAIQTALANTAPR
jgi:protein-disulfide isomerase